MPKPVANAPHISYRPGLDGLRALAVAAVFLYHARIDWLPGGFLGVDLFFVLSGYLITSLLLVEWEARNQIDLRRFWLRRARRLLPALVVAGDVAPGSPIDALSLVERYGPECAVAEPAQGLTELVETALAARRNGP